MAAQEFFERLPHRIRRFQKVTHRCRIAVLRHIHARRLGSNRIIDSKKVEYIPQDRLRVQVPVLIQIHSNLLTRKYFMKRLAIGEIAAVPPVAQVTTLFVDSIHICPERVIEVLMRLEPTYAVISQRVVRPGKTCERLPCANLAYNPYCAHIAPILRPYCAHIAPILRRSNFPRVRLCIPDRWSGLGLRRAFGAFSALIRFNQGLC